jgi:hypothetical protein
MQRPFIGANGDMTSALQEEVLIDACSSDNEITLKLLAAAATDEVLVGSEVRNSPSRCATDRRCDDWLWKDENERNARIR